MTTKYIYYIILATLLSVALVGCKDDIDPLVNELNLDRTLSPVGLEAVIRNRTTIELKWRTRSDVDHYVVEFSEDSLEFNNIIRTLTVLPDELPLQETFFGDKRYSARVKAISQSETDDSNWTAITIRTDSENIFLPLQNEDVSSTEATLTWEPGSDVTHFVINPGNDEREITAEEMEAGEAILTELASRTQYTVVLYKDGNQRGSISFKTLVDATAANATKVVATDDLSAVIAAAPAGQVLVLDPGDYTVFSGAIVINKEITIIGQYPYNKPKLHVNFSLEAGAGPLEFSDLEMTGDAVLSDAFRFATADVQYGTLTISGCNIHDFARSFIGGNVLSKVSSVVINNCVLTDVLTSGGDFIDFRTTHVTDLSITNSTFDNCAPARDFVRIDNAGFTGTGLNTNVLIDHCTLYGVSNSQDRITYVRFDTNTITVQNTLIAATDGYYTNQPSTTQPACDNNNYFNAAGFITPGYVTNAKTDISGTHTTLDPVFTNAVDGDFTLGNTALIDNEVGDPRWRQ